MIEQKEYIEITMADVLQEYLDDANLSQNALAKLLHVPATRIHEIMRNRRRITADTDLRLCKFFNKTNGFFLRIQSNLESRKTKLQIEKELESIVSYKKSA
ncbi:MAG: HigA family addiction module antitoxin [Alphaproteobacteria bacterium]|nr:HigA family addiction module antitoxin [Alphaproteobacteria bacterium]